MQQNQIGAIAIGELTEFPGRLGTWARVDRPWNYLATSPATAEGDRWDRLICSGENNCLPLPIVILLGAMIILWTSEIFKK
ncbi:MAG TPA: hypothetical protein V6C88_02405 [Chroococcidiopsis sp.]